MKSMNAFLICASLLFVVGCSEESDSTVVSSCAKHNVTNQVFFENNSATLSIRSKARLEDVANRLKDNPQMKVELRGYSSRLGKAEYNKRLASNRCNSVKSYLCGKLGPAFDKSRISVQGIGEVADQSMPESEARCVRIVVLD